MGHAILADGGREYWVIVTVRCDRCGAAYTGDFGPIGTVSENTVRWRGMGGA